MRTLAGLEGATNRVSELAVKFEPAIRNLPALTEDARKAVARADELMANLNKLTLDLTKEVSAVERVTKSAEQVGGAAQSLSGDGRQRDPAAHPRAGRRDRAHLAQPRPAARRPERAAGEPRVRPASRRCPGPGEPGFNPRRGATK